MNPQILANQINEKGYLTIGGVDTVDLAKEYGTPLVVYDVEQIRNQIRAFKKVFEEKRLLMQLVTLAKPLLVLRCIK